jgi:hypothetical protein
MKRTLFDVVIVGVVCTIVLVLTYFFAVYQNNKSIRHGLKIAGYGEHSVSVVTNSITENVHISRSQAAKVAAKEGVKILENRIPKYDYSRTTAVIVSVTFCYDTIAH